ncbi:hypothetical protein [Chitinophaga sp. OAE865]|uniref:hypothetical protein n=1 Tax=Chitinophaga sp. OAE865 TaxID=2817898 RepID=UPI001AEA98F6
MIEKNPLNLIELSPDELQLINGGGIITDVISAVVPSEYADGVLDSVFVYGKGVFTLVINQTNLPFSLQEKLIGLAHFLI